MWLFKMMSRVSLCIILSSAALVYFAPCVMSATNSDGWSGRKIQRPDDNRNYNHGLEFLRTLHRPLNIAHRGSSGVLPEHTREAYTRAIGVDRADVIECDLAVTRDGKFVCRHDPWLKASTDVASHPEFGDRKRTITFSDADNNRNITIESDWFVHDFTLAELKTLRATQTKPARDPTYNGKFEIATFHEFVEIAQSANRTVAIYPELKWPKWVNSLNLFGDNSSYEQTLVKELNMYGYTDETDACIVQSFDFSSLEKLFELTTLPLVVLNNRGSPLTPDSLTRYGEICYGVGVSKCDVVEHCTGSGDDFTYKNYISNTTDLVSRIHDAGMKVHVYTFRNEDSDLAWDYEQDPEREYDLYMQIGIDGFFTDFPGTLSRYLDDLYTGASSASSLTAARGGGIATTMALLVLLRDMWC